MHVDALRKVFINKIAQSVIDAEWEGSSDELTLRTAHLDADTRREVQQEVLNIYESMTDE